MLFLFSFFLYYFLALIIVTSLLRDWGELHNSRIRSKTHTNVYDSSITLNRLDFIEKCDYSWSCGCRRKMTTRWRRANLQGSRTLDPTAGEQFQFLDEDHRGLAFFLGLPFSIKSPVNQLIYGHCSELIMLCVWLQKDQ